MYDHYWYRIMASEGCEMPNGFFKKKKLNQEYTTVCYGTYQHAALPTCMYQTI
jgi:hypothetical protein